MRSRKVCAPSVLQNGCHYLVWPPSCLGQGRDGTRTVAAHPIQRTSARASANQVGGETLDAFAQSASGILRDP